MGTVTQLTTASNVGRILCQAWNDWSIVAGKRTPSMKSRYGSIFKHISVTPLTSSGGPRLHVTVGSPPVREWVRLILGRVNRYGWCPVQLVDESGAESGEAL
jgi:hypothetical protein